MNRFKVILRSVAILALSLIISINASAAEYAPWLYGNQLDGAARLAYDSMTEAFLSEGKDSVEFNVSDYGITGSELKSVISDAMSAMFCDYSYANFINSLSWTYYSSSYSGKVTQVIVCPKLSMAFSTAADYDKYAQTENRIMNEILSEIVKTSKTRYEVLDAINDWLVYNATYDNEAVVNMYTDRAETQYWYAWAPYGVLSKKTGVCASYARAFLLMCEKLDIPCVYVTGYGNGGSHAWNYVQMEDGKWYMVDVTFNDCYTEDSFKGYFSESEKKLYIDGAKHEYFLIGSDKGNKDHSAVSESNAFAFPSISKYDYVSSGIEESFILNEAVPHTFLMNYSSENNSAEGNIDEKKDSAEGTKVEEAGKEKDAEKEEEQEVKPYKKGDTFTDEKTGLEYIVVTASKTNGYQVSVTGISKSVKKVVIPVAVTVRNTQYRVVAIDDGAFTGNKKITSVTLGANIRSIGEEAFYGCKKLAAITINSKKLNYVGEKAISGIRSTAVIKVPGTKYNAYKSLFNRSSGFKADMKIEKK